METNKINYTNNNIKSNNFPANNLEATKIHKNTIKEEENDEELDQSYESGYKEKIEHAVNAQGNKINEDDDQEDYLDQNNVSNGEDDEEEEDFIDFNNQEALESDASEENKQDEEGIENIVSQNSEEAFNREEEEIKNTSTQVKIDHDPNEIENNNILDTSTKSENENIYENDYDNKNNINNHVDENHIVDANEEKIKKNHELTNQIQSNIRTKKNLAISLIKPLNKKKQKDADKSKNFFEDPRETKTIFSKISEEIFHKLSKDKFKKTSAYEYMTDDMYINRVVQKGDQDNKTKFNSFLERNNEFFNKKKLRLNEKIKKISEETNSNLYAIPNKKVLNKDEVRNPEQFFADQKNFKLQKEQFVEVQREEKIKKNILDSHNYIPEINKNSKSIAEKKINEKTEVFERLHNQRNYKEKQQILNEIVSNVNNNGNENKEQENLFVDKHHNKNDSNPNNINRNNNNIIANNKNRVSLLPKNMLRFEDNKPKPIKSALRLKGVKKPKSQMQSYSNKLHDDAKKLQEKLEEKAKHFYNNEALDLQCKQTKIMNIQKFIKSFNRNLKRAVKQKTFRNPNYNNEIPQTDSKRNQEIIICRLDFTDYCRLLRNLGFVKNSFEILKSHLEPGEIDNENTSQANNNYKKPDLKELNEKLVNPSKKPKLADNLIKREALLVLDSWKVLLSRVPQQSEHIAEISEIDDVNPRDILVFLCVVQGFLKGNIHTISKEEDIEIKQIKANKLFYLDNRRKNGNSRKELKGSHSLDKPVNLKANLNVNKNNDQIISGLNKKLKTTILSDDEDYLANKHDSEGLNPPNGEFNKFKRLKSKDSINKFLKKSTEINNNNLDENNENKYKRKKSKNNENFITSNNNDKEMSIPASKIFSEGNSPRAKCNGENAVDAIINPSESRFKRIMKSASKEKQRSLSNKNNKKINDKNLKGLTNQIVLTEENLDGIKKTANKAQEKIDDVYIINKFFEFIDLKNYPYNRAIAKKIKMIFRVFLENRVEFLLQNKLNDLDSQEEDHCDTAKESHAAYKIKQKTPNEKLKSKLYYERFKQRVMSQLENEMTFKPELNTSGNQSHSVVPNKRQKLKMEDAYEYQKKKRESELIKLRMLKAEDEMKNCTFQPNVDQPEKLPKNFNLNTLVDKLYKEGLSQRKEKTEQAKKNEQDKILKEVDPKTMTFKPSTIPLNQSIFNPMKIEAYEISKKNVERFEKARIEKKIAEIQKQTGITNLNQINNIDALLKENSYPSWNFTLEKKLHKDTFEVTSRFSKSNERKNESNPNIINTFNTVNTLTNSLNYTNTNPNSDHFINLDINLSDETSVKKLKVGLNDDPKIVAEDFANKYDLNEEKKMKLIVLIEEKLNENRIVYTQESNQSTAKKTKN